MSENIGFEIINAWLIHKDFKPFGFQLDTWEKINLGQSGLVNAPTGCGKTYAVFVGLLIRYINQYPQNYKSRVNNGLQLIWITPLRSLAKDIARAMDEALAELGIPWVVAIRNGDTSVADRQKQKRKIPEILLITPESLHLLLAQKGNWQYFEKLQLIAIDEWHELLGSKRGVQIELAVARLVHYNKMYNPQNLISIWGISATIGNLEEAMNVLIHSIKDVQDCHLIKANIEKDIIVESVIPDEVEKYPWAGHLGLKLAENVVSIIENNTTTLIFINTRGMSERWYQHLIDIAPQLAGAIALHHGSIEQELRLWVEDALHTQKLKAVVCTSSLDLGVDFRPVDAVVQVGSPKGIARFLQRAGRSGHRPGAISKIYFVPTHALELLEAAALKEAILLKSIESKEPLLLCFDVLVQYLCTLATGDGFVPDQLYGEIKKTYCYSEISPKEWQQVLLQITQGGTSLNSYDDYHKIEVENGIYKIKNRRLAMRHRMQIGTIVSDAMLKVKFISGGYIGVIEEWFISRLEIGDVFTLAGKNLELVTFKDMTVLVRKSNSKKSLVPSWMGSRMSLSANLGAILRTTFNQIFTNTTSKEILSLQPLFLLQQWLSHVPRENELLVEMIEAKDGYHLVIYPFEGRQIHEALSAILAYRISQMVKITFSISMNDYGFELLSDVPIPVNEANIRSLLTSDGLILDIQKSVNNTEMTKRRFRDIAVIGGLVFQGKPGEQIKARHLQSNTGLLFQVFMEYEPNNILLLQAYKEVLEQQMEEVRLRQALKRIQDNPIVFKRPLQFTPLSFPIIVDGLNRNNLSSEKLEEKILRLQKSLKQ